MEREGTVPNAKTQRLVIVESPAKAKTISGYLGPGYVVEASYGHVRDLPRNAADVPAKYKGESWSSLGVDVDKFERDLTAERTAAALAHKRNEGKRVSGLAPFGFRFEGGAVVPDEPERQTLARIRAMRDGGSSLRCIAAELNAQAVPARGRKWHLRSVQLALEAA